MAQPTNTKPNSPSFGAIVAALVVVAVFVILGFVLANSRPGTQATAGTASTAAAEATLPTEAAGLPTAPAVAGAASIDPAVVARNDKYKTQGAPKMAIDPKKNYTATITTPRGDIQIKLRPDLAPETVNNFVFLAKEGFYDGVTWHRVLPNFMAQTGDPTGTGTGGPGYSIKGEFTDKVLFDKPGMVAMARSNDPNSGGSQFFITTAPYPSLNSQYAIFGEVTKGQEIVDAIPLRDPDGNPPPAAPGEKIVKVTVTEG